MQASTASRSVIPRVVRLQTSAAVRATPKASPSNRGLRVSCAANDARANNRTGTARASQFGRRGLFNKVTGAVFTTSIFGMGVTGRPQSVAAYSSKIDSVLEKPDYPPAWPFKATDFSRYDESTDDGFYESPRFVTHIDGPAIDALTKYYAKEFPKSGNDDVAILDLCSSWISHFPTGYTAGRISGIGMNEKELAKNDVLTDYEVKDLNVDATLPYPDATFDVITNAVSVDYLTRPLEMFKEMQRVLKPGGVAIMSFSNRCFPTKAISIWTSTGDPDHVWIVGSYYHYTPGFTAPQGIDISPNPGRSDPMYIVTAKKA